MQFLNRLFDFYLNSSIHTALAVCSLTWITLVNFNVGVELNFIYFMFFATITGYNFVMYYGLAKFHHRGLATWLKYIQVFSLLSFIALGYFTFKLPFTTLLYLGGLGIITFFYTMPFLPKSVLVDGKDNLREISGLKTFIIAFVWAVATVIIPLLNENFSVNNDVLITSIQIYIYVLVVIIPFDIRDMKFDSIKLATFPQKMGIKRTKVIAVFLIGIFFLLEFLKDEFWLKQVYIFGFVSFLMLMAILFSSRKRNKYYSAFWVESIPIVWLVLTLVNY